ncbi:hypothetical protein CB1_000471030 [Camelus ferus]|nr:hypothetical protein CB1_000471030 [Camelus ferus]
MHPTSLLRSPGEMAKDWKSFPSVDVTQTCRQAAGRQVSRVMSALEASVRSMDQCGEHGKMKAGSPNLAFEVPCNPGMLSNPTSMLLFNIESDSSLKPCREALKPLLRTGPAVPRGSHPAAGHPLTDSFSLTGSGPNPFGADSIALFWKEWGIDRYF